MKAEGTEEKILVSYDMKVTPSTYYIHTKDGHNSEME